MLGLTSQNMSSQLELPNEDYVPDEQENGNNSQPPAEISSTGKVYFVSTLGDDDNLGSRDKPFRTIAFAVSKMVAGDTTYARGGIYKEALIRFDKTGTETKPIKLLNYPNELPIVDFGVNGDRSKTDRRFEFQNAEGLIKPMGWITLEGFEIRNGYNAIKYYNLHDSIIRRNNMHHHVSSGIKGNGSLRVTIDRNRIHANGDFAGCERGDLTENGAGQTTVCNQQHGLYIDGRFLVITNNLIYNNLCTGVQMNGSSGYSPNGHTSVEFSGAYDWTIANNTIAYQYYCPGIVVWGSQSVRTKIYNNIFYENGTSRDSNQTNGITITASVDQKVEVTNNLFYESGSGATLPINSAAVEDVQFTQSGNIYDKSPAFVNAPAVLPSSPNFILTSQSSARDKGITTSATKIDFLGVPRLRGGAYDIGAYEY